MPAYLLTSLVLGKAESEVLDHHHKVQLERLQRLYPGTPAPVVFFLSGSLPASAVLHLRQLSLLGMLARLGPDSILHRHGRHILIQPKFSPPLISSQSWFIQVRALCEQYRLPDPLYVLANPPKKEEWKAHCRLRVTEYWAELLRQHAASLSSLEHFRASHMSLSRPSPLWGSCGSSQYEVRKATVQVRMLSGRYRTCWLRRHWAGDESGHCRVPGCTGSMPGTLAHMVTGECPGLASAKAAAVRHWVSFLTDNPFLLPVIQEHLTASPTQFLAFLLDPSVQPSVIAFTQKLGTSVTDKLCHMARTWLYHFHRERLKKLELWA